TWTAGCSTTSRSGKPSASPRSSTPWTRATTSTAASSSSTRTCASRRTSSASPCTGRSSWRTRTFSARSTAWIWSAAPLDRLASHAGSLLAAVMNEAQAIEEDKIYQTRDRFALRDRARELLDEALRRDPPQSELRTLRDACAQLIREANERVMIPAGSPTLVGELRRVIAEEPALLGELAGQESAFVELQNDSPIARTDLWLRALCFVLLDLVMDLEGKSERSRLIAIAPIVGI